MTETPAFPDAAAGPLGRAVRLTLWGMAAERLVRCFWPLVSIILATLACLMFGLQDVLPLEAFWALSVISVLGTLTALVLGLRRFRWPRRVEALQRLDATLPGRPIQAITDRQAIGAGDAASEAVWRAHLARMAERLRGVRAVEPDLRVAARDPFALRHVALVAFAMALIFGSVWRVASVTGMAPGGAGGAAAAGASWEGWIEPPAYTGKPSLYLADIPAGPLAVPDGSRVTLRLYGEVGQLIVDETVSGRTQGIEGASDPAQSFDAVQDGRLEIRGPGGREWTLEVLPDTPPVIAPTGAAERTVRGEMKQEFAASDDYGVAGAAAEIALDLAAVDRRYGLAAEPEPREPIRVELPLPLGRNRREFTQTLTEDLSQHPWANLPVTITYVAEDAAGQQGRAEPAAITLPGRRFFDVMAQALVENRRDLLWNRANARRVAQVLRAVSWHPDDAFRQPGVYLKLRTVIRRIETEGAAGPLADETRDEIAGVLWSLALEIEDGGLEDALERMRQAQERLAEAIRNGATKDEIAKLMDELRKATDDYIARLAEEAPDGTDRPDPGGQQQAMTGDQLEEMMQRLQQLMEEGRTAEAQALLEQLQQLMENLQVTKSPGEGGPGQKAIEGLSETLKDQQELSDDTFGDLNDPDRERREARRQDPGRQGNGQQNPGQQNPGQQGGGQQDPGQQAGEAAPDGQAQDGGQGGDGQSDGGQQGQQGQQGRESGQGTLPGQGDGNRAGRAQGDVAPDGRTPGERLAERQDDLRRLLDEQLRTVPGAGSVEGDAARDALGRAARAMDEAERALRDGDLGGALDSQADAMEALREGMRSLSEMLAQAPQPGQNGSDRMGEAGQPPGRRDPLGRNPGADGRIGSDESLLQGEDVYRRARELLEELRRRSADQARPEVEKDYLRRLLERF